jgi:hypothetical protein
MANLCMAGLEKLKSAVLSSGNAALAEISTRDQRYWKPLDDRSVRIENVPADLADQNRETIYPSVYLYSARMDNSLRQKFNGFTGPVRFVIDIRCTAERFEGLEQELTSYVEAVTTGLAKNTGSWGENLIYSGAYTVKFDPIKQGGRNFIHSAKIELEAEACG